MFCTITGNEPEGGSEQLQNINLNVAIIKNTFQQVEVSNIQNIDIGGEPVRRNNTFKDCYINGELQNQ